MNAHSARGDVEDLILELRDHLLAIGYTDVSLDGDDIALVPGKNVICHVMIPMLNLLKVSLSKRKCGNIAAADAL